ncbi:unnamed protein product, partial [Mesorhabditis spiculigera]
MGIERSDKTGQRKGLSDRRRAISKRLKQFDLYNEFGYEGFLDDDDDDPPQVNDFVLQWLFAEGFEPNGFPSIRALPQWHLRIAHEMVIYYKKHGVVPDYFC